MEIIHTSDWHLGHRLYGYDRTDEFLHFLNSLENILNERRPDALVVAGDIFDIANPPASTARMFTDGLLRLHAASPSTRIVVISGNHDSSSRIDIDRNLWKTGGIDVIGSLSRTDGAYDFSQNILDIDGKGWIVAIPFINRAFLTRLGTGSLSPEGSLMKEAALALRKINPDGLPALLTAHLTVADSDRQGHLAAIGGVDSVPASEFPDDFSYAALGHIHKPQSFRGDRIRYSGSPVPVSFDEQYPHGVLSVRIGRDGVAESEFIELKPLRPVMDFPREDVDFKKALKLLAKVPQGHDVYLRLRVVQDSPLPSDAMQTASEKCSGKKCRFCVISHSNPRRDGNKALSPAIDPVKFRETPPVEIARQFLLASGLDSVTIEKSLTLLSSLLGEMESEQSL